MTAPKLLCLLPVRNGEQDLPDYFRSVERFADGIIALDDGSTDRTRELLEDHPLVTGVLSSPRRPDYRTWDDAGNRNRLLAAAAELEPEWILSLDADERIPADDAGALRAFIENEALPGCAYGFQVFRMWHDLSHYEPAGLWVYRLFAFERGQRFPDQRLHFVPIPTDVPRDRWLRTTVRIQHLGSVTEQRRHARYAKYRQADPDNEFQHSYRDLLSVPEEIDTWPDRPEGLPVLDVNVDDLDVALDDAQQPALAEISGRPALSAVVISRNDEDRIARTVKSIVSQRCPWPFEVIVVTSGTDRTAEIVREQFPTVRLVELDKPALPGEARNAGLRIARGDYITFPGSHVELPQGSFEARLRTHDLGYAMVTGSTLNGTTTWAGWASYFLDHSGMLPGRPSAVFPTAPPHCSYRRSALLAIGGFPENMRAGEDTVVNQELTRRGFTTYWAQDVQFIHHSPCRTPRRLAAHHFVRGRGFGRILREQNHPCGRALIGRPALTLFRRQVPQRAALIRANVKRWANDSSVQREYRRAMPLIVLGATAAYLGSCFELVRPQRFVSPIEERTPGMQAEDAGDVPKVSPGLPLTAR